MICRGTATAASDEGILHVTESSHPDLFWALKGAGWFVGIVVAFDVTLYEVPPQLPVQVRALIHDGGWMVYVAICTVVDCNLLLSFASTNIVTSDERQ